MIQYRYQYSKGISKNISDPTRANGFIGHVKDRNQSSDSKFTEHDYIVQESKDV